MKKPKVYIAGPYTGENIRNINKALRWANILYSDGFIPFVPHLSGFWDLVYPMEYENWMEYDEEWLLMCDCVYRLQGASLGADQEIKVALDHNIPVFIDIRKLREWKLTWENSHEPRDN